MITYSGISTLGRSAGGIFNANNNTFIGANTFSILEQTNSTALGYSASVTASNQVRIGNTAVTSIGGQVNWTNLSDGRFKKNIKEDVPGLEFINSLRPVTYNLDVAGIDAKLNAATQQEVNEAMTSLNNGNEARKAAPKSEPSAEEQKAKSDKAKVKYTGFVAQEVEKAAKKLNYDFSGVDAPKNSEDFYGLRYSEFVVPLVKSVQELSAENKELARKNEELEKRLAKLEALMAGGNGNGNNGGNTVVTLSSAFLEQNAPNPFHTATIIKYHLPQGAFAAQVVITNAKGQALKSIPLGTGSSGQVTLQGGTLAAGSYNYSLWVDGKQVDTKQMLIVR
ncbi:tail fiber domain-containing protein [Flavisolibacter sp. BT320]|nr:tail fiber domain-containing protein [Flavisolibacter longurius]